MAQSGLIFGDQVGPFSIDTNSLTFRAYTDADRCFFGGHAGSPVSGSQSAQVRPLLFLSSAILRHIHWTTCSLTYPGERCIVLEYYPPSGGAMGVQVSPPKRRAGFLVGAGLLISLCIGALSHSAGEAASWFRAAAAAEPLRARRRPPRRRPPAAEALSSDRGPDLHSFAIPYGYLHGPGRERHTYSHLGSRQFPHSHTFSLHGGQPTPSPTPVPSPTASGSPGKSTSTATTEITSTPSPARSPPPPRPVRQRSPRPLRPPHPRRSQRPCLRRLC